MLNCSLFFVISSFFYSNYDKLTTWIPVCKLCIIGEKYQVPDIRNIAEEYMETLPENCRTPTTLTTDIVWEAIESNVFSCPLLHEMHDYFKENAKAIICAENIFNAPKNFIYEILLMDDLNVDEFDLLHAITEWSDRNMTPCNFEKFKKFYKHIRFGAVNFHDFLDLKKCFPKILDEEDFGHILEYLYSTSVRSLPEWCSSNHVWRKNEFNLRKRMKIEYKQNDNSNEMCEQNNESIDECDQKDNKKD